MNSGLRAFHAAKVDCLAWAGPFCRIVNAVQTHIASSSTASMANITECSEIVSVVRNPKPMHALTRAEEAHPDGVPKLISRNVNRLV